MSKIAIWIVTTPSTRQGRVVSGIGCGPLATLGVPAVILGYGLAISMAIFAPLVVGLAAVVHRVDKRAA